MWGFGGLDPEGKECILRIFGCQTIQPEHTAARADVVENPSYATAAVCGGRFTPAWTGGLMRHDAGTNPALHGVAEDPAPGNTTNQLRHVPLNALPPRVRTGPLFPLQSPPPNVDGVRTGAVCAPERKSKMQCNGVNNA